VQPDRDDTTAEPVGEPVVVVPTVAPGLVGVAMGPYAREFGEVEVAAVGELADPDRAARTMSGSG